MGEKKEKEEKEEEEEEEEEENKKTVTHLDTIGVIVRRLTGGSQGQRADGGDRKGRLACGRRNVTWWSTAPPTSPAPDFSVHSAPSTWPPYTVASRALIPATHHCTQTANSRSACPVN